MAPRPAAPSPNSPCLLPPVRACVSQLNMIVIGHVDAGKSTLMGQLLLAARAVDERVHKYARESEQAGKGCFVYVGARPGREESAA